MSALLAEQVWRLNAACRGPQAMVFFPPAHFERKEEKLERERRAKAICQMCSVQGSCLEYAVSIREQHGIWGGLNEAERKMMFAHKPKPARKATTTAARKSKKKIRTSI